MSNIRWVFLRHGESTANAGGWFAGQRDSDLTAAGVAQATAVRDAVRRLEVDRVLVSDLLRARRTAALALEGLDWPVSHHPELRERSAGELEGRTVASTRVSGDYPLFAHWDWRPPGGESLADVATRAIAFLAAADDARDTLVVCHGALMRAAIGFLDGRPLAEIGHWAPTNCELVERRLPLGTWALVLKRLAALTLDKGEVPA